MSKTSSSKPAKLIRAQLSSAVLSQASESGDEGEESERDSLVDAEEGSSADSDELEDVAPRRRENGGTTPSGSRGTTGQRREPARLPRYTAPRGMMPLDPSVKFAESPFEWDAMADSPGLELWAIRAPKDLKPTRLASLNLTVSKSGASGILTTKSASYTLRPAGAPIPAAADVDAEGRQPTAGPGIADAMTMEDDGGERMKFEGGGEMMGGMRLMVPRASKGGKLFAAPLAITRQFILVPDTPHSTSASTETPLPSLLATSTLDDALDAAEAERVISQAPAKRFQPRHLFKLRNQPVGTNTAGPGKGPDPSIELSPVFLEPPLPEAPLPEAPLPEVSSQMSGGDTPAKKKKRKSEGDRDTPGKKSKKVKV